MPQAERLLYVNFHLKKFNINIHENNEKSFSLLNIFILLYLDNEKTAR